MTTDLEIEIANRILSTGLLTKVYHSCHMLRTDQDQRLYPVYKSGTEYIYAGVDDTKGMFAYIRHNGDTTQRPVKLAGCEKAYELMTPIRVVFFNDHEDRDFNFLVKRLAGFTMMQSVNLQRVIDDKWRLRSEESDLQRHKFDGKTFFVAFDVLLNILLLPSHCDETVCKIYQNPICQ